ncbi:hypothetical protein INP83_20010 [Mucilaginibacter sp. 21P]|uniref:hypothetical protein n=1 Tax=Mucilaginibacter sp. 21P TaxID=2778902 RepID=UPI001C58A81A|nr:hypothetical protein [Mucilaginibacter sp. 21P]QXV65327.1 hypothetical protein INP83_20010 [Mucilaginibacter sp. 21P]
MTKAQYQEAIKTERLPLTPWEKFDHFGIVIYCLMPTVMLPVFYLWRCINDEHLEFNTKHVEVLSISVIVSIFFFWLQNYRLRLQVIPAALCKKDLKEVTLQVLKELKWHGRFNGTVCVVRTDRSFFSGSWGEQVTLIVDADRVLINSICDLKKRSSITSWGNNGKNVKDFTERFQEYASRQMKAECSAIKIEN